VAKRLFHELGHSMHGALARTRCAQQHLIVGRYMVYSEAVSMVFEQFLWTPRHMRECSLHYSHLSAEYARAWRAANPGKELPPRELPEATIAATLAARKRSAAILVRSQIVLARWDLAAHGPPSREAMLNMDLASVYNKIRIDVTGMSGEEVETGRFDGTHGFATKRLIAGGYAAYYYCYIFSQVWAHDLFAVGFKGATMDAERGRRYRRIVLERGLGMAPMDIMREFLGREPNDTAYFEAHGM
jgi:metallopeptidase MepB